MDDDIREFGERLGRHCLARDWDQVHQLLAPWLRPTLTPDGVREFFEAEYRKTLDANDIPAMHYPEYPDPGVDGNGFMTATKLREPISWEGDRVRDVPAEVTDANVRYWLKLQLLASDEQMEALGFDTFSETWMSIVTTPEGLRVGYWEVS